MKTRLFLLVIAFCVGIVSFSQTIRYVKKGGTGTGTSWADASGNLKGILDAAAANTQIWVAVGTYTPTTGTDRNVSFVMKNDVAIYGGFAGNETQLNDRNFTTNTTILSGDLNNNDVVTGSGSSLNIANNSENSVHVINNDFSSSPPLNTTAILNGFTVKGGYSDNYVNGSGGGMFNSNASPSINNVIFTGNKSNAAGGGIQNTFGSSPIFNNCTISYNFCNGNSGGGGMNNFKADGTSYAGSNPTLNGVTFIGNKAGNPGGGAVYNSNCSPNYTNCAFIENYAYSSAGAIANYNATSNLTNCSFVNNNTTGNGGAMWIENSTMVITNCLFTDNHSYFYGGVSHNKSSNVTVTNCTFYNNSSTYGAPVYKASGVMQSDGTNAVLNIENSIFWANGGLFGGTQPTINYSIVQGGYSGTGNLSADPWFVDPANGNFRLLATSPAINAGSNAAIPPGITTDLDGNSRIQLSIVDMGAYEAACQFQGNPTLFVTPSIFGNNTWNVYAWNAGGANFTNNTDCWNTNYAGYYTDNNLNINTTANWDQSASPSAATGYIGCTVQVDNMSFAAKRQGFPCGYYQLDIPGHDDGAQLWINGAMVWSQDGYNANTLTNVWTGWLGPNDKVELKVTEGSGGSFGKLNFVALTPNNGDPTIFGNNTWNVYAWNAGGAEFTNNPDCWNTNYAGYYTDNNLNINTTANWNESASPSAATGYIGCTVEIDNMSFAAKRQGFSCGYYRLDIPIHDNGAQLWINGAMVWSEDGFNANTLTNVWTGWLGPNDKVEFRVTEGTGGSSGKLNFVALTPNNGDPTVFGTNTWNVYAWNAGGASFTNNTDCWNTNYAGYYTNSSLNINTANDWNNLTSPSHADNYVGCVVQNDNHSYSAKRQGFPCGYYQLDIPGHDDGAQLFINDIKVWEHDGCCDSHTNVWSGNLGTNDKVEFRVTEGSGESYGLLNFTQLASGIVYVDSSKATDGNGFSWANACNNLQTALAAANSCNGITQIWVAKGTYKPTTGTDRTISFAMKNGVAIYGGFAGTETALSQRPTINTTTGNPSSTTLSGDIDNDGTLTNNSYHVISNPQGLNATAVLDGFVITGGNANSNVIPDNYGGGVFNNGSGTGNFCNPTLRNCSFQGNSAFYYGGAMCNYGYNGGTSSPTLTNCSFQGNAAVYGGAMSNFGLFAGTSSPSLTNCSFNGNSASSFGGAMYNIGYNGRSSPMLTNCSFEANTASFGGAMYNDGSSGGGSTPLLTNCAFQGNNASYSGGGMFNNGNNGSGSPSLTNCSFQSNTAANGGAMCNDGSSGGSSIPILTNCVLFGNGGSNTFYNRFASGASATYSLFDNTNGVDVMGAGNLTTITNPFSSTTTATLNACSPAINAGLNSATGLAGITTDLVGNPRIFGGTVDMGAYEASYQSTGNPTVFGSNTWNLYAWNAGGGSFTNNTNCWNTNYAGYYTNSSLNINTQTDWDQNTSPSNAANYQGCAVGNDNHSWSAKRQGFICGYYQLDVPGHDDGAQLFINGNKVWEHDGCCDSHTNVWSGNLGTNDKVEFRVTEGGSESYGLLNFTQLASGIVYVDSSKATDGNGFSWANACNNLQTALAAANSCNGIAQIWVAKGTYKPTTGTDRTISFAMKNGVAIYGGFAGTETALSQRPTINPITGSPSSTTLSGDIGTVGDNSDNSYHVIANPVGLNTTAVLDGFVITGGNANANDRPDNYGGGVFNNGSGSGNFCNPTLRNCSFQGNSSSFHGGAMYNYGYNGGTSSPSLTNCSFQGNSATNQGGAMNNDGAFGGASSPSLTNCSFQGNTAKYGGAVSNFVFSGGISSPLLTNCSFQDNSASSFGGAMYNSGQSGTSSPSLTNCSFQNNSAAAGGAMFSNGSGGNSNPVLTNCVLFGNGGSNTFYNSSTSGASATYSLFDNTVIGYTGSNNLITGTNPFSSTTTVTLFACSPAINAGLNSATGLTGITTDLAGNPRIFGGIVDMGAYEYQAAITDGTTALPAASMSLVQVVGGNTYLGNCNALLAYLQPNGGTPLSGGITARVWIEPTTPNYGGRPYVKRHYEITPATNPTTSSSRVTLYFLQSEFDAFNMFPYNGPDLPSGPADVAGISNLRITKYSGVSGDGSGTPGSYASGPSIIDPADNDIIWNASLSRWEVSFDVTGFSGFVAGNTEPIILPITWLHVSGTINSQKQAVINWQVQEQNVAGYEVEKSTDAIHFVGIGNMAGKGDGTHSYSLTEGQTLTGTGFYRIRQIAKDGSFSYSGIIKLIATNSSYITIYPNPVSAGQSLVLSIGNNILHSWKLVDMLGRVLTTQDGLDFTGTMQVNMPGNLTPGIYQLLLQTDKGMQSEKLMVK